MSLPELIKLIDDVENGILTIHEALILIKLDKLELELEQEQLTKRKVDNER